MTIKEFTEDRDSAFTEFVHTDNWNAVKEFALKYGLSEIDNDVARAGVYKAIQECPNISEDTKRIAREKCIALGFEPYMR